MKCPAVLSSFSHSTVSVLFPLPASFGELPSTEDKRISCFLPPCAPPAADTAAAPSTLHPRAHDCSTITTLRPYQRFRAFPIAPPPPLPRCAVGGAAAQSNGRPQRSAVQRSALRHSHDDRQARTPRRAHSRRDAAVAASTAGCDGAHCSRAVPTRRSVSPEPLRLPSPIHAPVARRARRPCGPVREAHDQTIRMLTVRMDGCALCSCV